MIMIITMVDNQSPGGLNVCELRLPVQQSHLPGLHHFVTFSFNQDDFGEETSMMSFVTKVKVIKEQLLSRVVLILTILQGSNCIFNDITTGEKPE